MRLALALGYASPSRMLDEMTAEDYSLWTSFEQAIGPIGVERDDLRISAAAVQICNSVAAISGSKARLKPADLVPYKAPWSSTFGKSVYHVTDPEQQVAIWRALAGQSHGQEDRQPGGDPERGPEPVR